VDIDAVAQLNKHLNEISFGGEHPLMVIAPRDELKTVLSLLANMREALEKIAAGRRNAPFDPWAREVARAALGE
jgi:hypothetical protein